MSTLNNQIENKESLEIADKIITDEFVDGIFIGRYDLSISLDIVIKSYEMIEIIKKIGRLCKKKIK